MRGCMEVLPTQYLPWMRSVLVVIGAPETKGNLQLTDRIV